MSELLESELTGRIIGCAMKVHAELGPGLREKTYERALCVEFKRQGIAFETQSQFPVYYADELVDTFIPDLIVEMKVIVDTKTVQAMGAEEKAQMFCFLRVTKLKVGLTINFKNIKLQWERTVLDTALKNPR